MDAIPLDQVYLDSKSGARPVQVMVHGFESSSALKDSHRDTSAKRLKPTERSIGGCPPRLDAPQTFIKIHTVPNGFNSGRTYFLRFPHTLQEESKTDEWREAELKKTEKLTKLADDLNQLAAAARRRVEAKSRFERHQARHLRTPHRASGPY